MGNSILLDILYPKRCPLCGNIRSFGESGMCSGCEKELVWVKEPVCLKCGKMIEDETKEYCSDCTRIPKSFERCYPALCYEGRIKDSIYDFKYKNQRSYASFFADCIMKRHGDELKRLDIDGIVPVPVHRHKRKKRGYNQAELIAAELGKALGIKVFPDYIERTADTDPQKELNDTERLKNLNNAFKIGKNDVKLDTVLLVDDIYTSGATMEACTKVLLDYGVNKVYCSSLAIGRGYSG
jgi:ComF family protein